MVTSCPCQLGSVVELKRPHPCASRSRLFKIVRVGADVKLQCQGCGTIVMLTREDYNRRFKSVIVEEPPKP